VHVGGAEQTVEGVHLGDEQARTNSPSIAPTFNIVLRRWRSSGGGGRSGIVAAFSTAATIRNSAKQVNAIEFADRGAVVVGGAELEEDSRPMVMVKPGEPDRGPLSWWSARTRRGGGVLIERKCNSGGTW